MGDPKSQPYQALQQYLTTLQAQYGSIFDARPDRLLDCLANCPERFDENFHRYPITQQINKSIADLYGEEVSNSVRSLMEQGGEEVEPGQHSRIAEAIMSDTRFQEYLQSLGQSMQSQADFLNKKAQEDGIPTSFFASRPARAPTPPKGSGPPSARNPHANTLENFFQGSGTQVLDFSSGWETFSASADSDFSWQDTINNEIPPQQEARNHAANLSPSNPNGLEARIAAVEALSKMSAGDICCNEYWPEICLDFANALNDPHPRITMGLLDLHIRIFKAAAAEQTGEIFVNVVSHLKEYISTAKVWPTAIRDEDEGFYMLLKKFRTAWKFAIDLPTYWLNFSPQSEEKMYDAMFSLLSMRIPRFMGDTASSSSTPSYPTSPDQPSHSTPSGDSSMGPSANTTPAPASASSSTPNSPQGSVDPSWQAASAGVNGLKSRPLLHLDPSFPILSSPLVYMVMIDPNAIWLQRWIKASSARRALIKSMHSSGFLHRIIGLSLSDGIPVATFELLRSHSLQLLNEELDDKKSIPGPSSSTAASLDKSPNLEPNQRHVIEHLILHCLTIVGNVLTYKEGQGYLPLNFVIEYEFQSLSEFSHSSTETYSPNPSPNPSNPFSPSPSDAPTSIPGSPQSSTPGHGKSVTAGAMVHGLIFHLISTFYNMSPVYLDLGAKVRPSPPPAPPKMPETGKQETKQKSRRTMAALEHPNPFAVQSSRRLTYACYESLFHLMENDGSAGLLGSDHLMHLLYPIHDLCAWRLTSNPEDQGRTIALPGYMDDCLIKILNLCNTLMGCRRGRALLSETSVEEHHSDTPFATRTPLPTPTAMDSPIHGTHGTYPNSEAPYSSASSTSSRPGVETHGSASVSPALEVGDMKGRVSKPMAMDASIMQGQCASEVSHNQQGPSKFISLLLTFTSHAFTGSSPFLITRKVKTCLLALIRAFSRHVTFIPWLHQFNIYEAMATLYIKSGFPVGPPWKDSITHEKTSSTYKWYLLLLDTFLDVAHVAEGMHHLVYTLSTSNIIHHCFVRLLARFFTYDNRTQERHLLYQFLSVESARELLISCALQSIDFDMNALIDDLPAEWEPMTALDVSRKAEVESAQLHLELYYLFLTPRTGITTPEEIFGRANTCLEQLLWKSVLSYSQEGEIQGGMASDEKLCFGLRMLRLMSSGLNSMVWLDAQYGITDAILKQQDFAKLPIQDDLDDQSLDSRKVAEEVAKVIPVEIIAPDPNNDREGETQEAQADAPEGDMDVEYVAEDRDPRMRQEKYILDACSLLRHYLLVRWYYIGGSSERSAPHQQADVLFEKLTLTDLDAVSPAFSTLSLLPVPKWCPNPDSEAAPKGGKLSEPFLNDPQQWTDPQESETPAGPLPTTYPPDIPEAPKGPPTPPHTPDLPMPRMFSSLPPPYRVPPYIPPPIPKKTQNVLNTVQSALSQRGEADGVQWKAKLKDNFLLAWDLFLPSEISPSPLPGILHTMDVPEEDIPDIPILYPRGGISYHHCQSIYTRILLGAVADTTCNIEITMCAAPKVTKMQERASRLAAQLMSRYGVSLSLFDNEAFNIRHMMTTLAQVHALLAAHPHGDAKRDCSSSGVVSVPLVPPPQKKLLLTAETTAPVIEFTILESDSSAPEFIDWFPYIIYTLFCGNTNEGVRGGNPRHSTAKENASKRETECIAFLHAFAHFPRCKYLWFSRPQYDKQSSGSASSPTARGGGMEIIASLVESIIQMEFNDIHCCCVLNGVSIPEIVTQWLSQHFLNVLDWSELVHSVVTPIVMGIDYIVYFTVSIFYHIRHHIHNESCRGNLREWLLLNPIPDGFQSARLQNVMTSLHTKYHNYCMERMD